MVDNWQPTGGVDQYVEWSPTAKEHGEFYTDDNAFELYKANAKVRAVHPPVLGGTKYSIIFSSVLGATKCQNIQLLFS